MPKDKRGTYQKNSKDVPVVLWVNPNCSFPYNFCRFVILFCDYCIFLHWHVRSCEILWDLVSLLSSEVAADFGIQVLLDLHAFPGGSSAGTFNGVWPLNPRFWTAHFKENFTTIIVQLLDWMEALGRKNPKAFAGLYGLSPMNEPAHMRGLYDKSGAAVPVPYQKAYDELGLKGWASISTTDILQTLAISVDEFRKRPALEQQKMLLMNVIETTFAGTFGGKEDASAFAASQKGEVGSVTGAIGAWWKEITTESERKRWAVLDLHNYIAWNPDVKGFEDIVTMEDYRHLLNEMSVPFFQQLRSRLEMPQPQLLACSEYSASTNQDTLLSVTSGVGRRPMSLPREISWQHLRDDFLRCQHRLLGIRKLICGFGPTTSARTGITKESGPCSTFFHLGPGSKDLDCCLWAGAWVTWPTPVAGYCCTGYEGRGASFG